MPTSSSRTPKRRNGHTRLIDLALQGGGAHGAFTWGVLDRLLEEGDLEIEGISGTSAGAMNAAVLIDGHTQGGRKERAPTWRASGVGFRRRRRSARCGAGFLTCSSTAGAWTIRPSSSLWI